MCCQLPKKFIKKKLLKFDKVVEMKKQTFETLCAMPFVFALLKVYVNTTKSRNPLWYKIRPGNTFFN